MKDYKETGIPVISYLWDKDGFPLFQDTEEEEDVYYRYSEEFSEKGYELSEIEKWLTEYKFEVLGVYEELTKNEISEKTQRAVFVARKHGTQ